MADRPEITSPEDATPFWRRRSTLAVGAAGLAVVVVAAVVLAVNRAPIAEKIVQDKLAELGLGGSELSITRLTPWAVEVENLATGPAGTARIARLTAGLSWPSWTAPRVSTLTLEGVQLSLAYKDGTPDWGDLAPLVAGGGRGGAAVPVPAVTLSDAFVEIEHPAGPLALSLSGVEIEPKAGGALDLKQAALEVVHPAGQATLRVAGRRDAEGGLALDIEVEDAHGTAGPVSVSEASGTLRLAIDPRQPERLRGEGTVKVAGLALPGGLLASGTLGLKMEEGAATATAALVDEGLGLTMNARAEGMPFDPSAEASVMARASAVSFARLSLGDGIKGNGSLEIKTKGPLRDLTSGDPGRLPPFEVAADLAALEYPGVPGTWTAKTAARAFLGDGTLAVKLTDPLTLSGQAWGGDLGASVAGAAMLSLSPVRMTKAEVTELRLTATKAAAGGVSVAGPLAVVLTPRGDGLTFNDREGAFPLAKADFAFKVESPSMILRSGGRTAVLRTASVTGGIAATLPAEGKRGMKLSLSGLNAHVPDLDVEAEGLALNASTRGGPDGSWNLVAAAKSLRHTAAAPFSAKAQAHWAPRKWSVEGTLRQTATNLIASFAASQDTRSGAGRMRVDTVPLNLAAVDGGVQAITPLAAPFVKSMTGTVQVSAVGSWDKLGLMPLQVTGSLRGAGITPAPALLPDGLKGAVAGVGSLAAELTLPADDPAAGKGTVALTGGNLRLGGTQVSGISGQIDVTRLWPFETPPGQEVRIEHVVAALPAADGRLRFQVKSPDMVRLERAELTGIGGKIWAEDITVAEGRLPEKVVVHVDKLGLADLAAQLNILGLKADGKLSGQVPVLLGASGAVSIEGGLLESQGKGLLQFKPPTRAAAGQPQEGGRMDLVLDILEDLRFDGMTLSLDGDARKDVRMKLRVQGRNPKIQQGRPVDLTVNLTGNLGEAIQAEFQNFDIKGLTGAAARK